MKKTTVQVKHTYESWLAAVDAIIDGKYGCAMDDGVDWLSRDAFDEGLSPAQAVKVWRQAQN